MSVIRIPAKPAAFVAALLAVSAPAWAQPAFTELYAFTGGNDGADPLAAVTLDQAGNIYGEAFAGGVVCLQMARGCGTVYKIDPSGHETTLVAFNNQNGLNPEGQPLVIGDTLYGSAGGIQPGYCGLIFSVKTDGSNFTALHLFDQAHGCLPVGPLILAPGGKAIYGITTEGGRGHHQGDGIVFQLNIGGAFDILYGFHGPDGVNPNSLLIDASGTLYGSTSTGGADNEGTVFSLSPKTSAFSTLYSFTGKADESNPTLGSIDGNGVLYGATQIAPLQIHHYGTLFSLTPGATGYAYTQLHEFGAGGSQNGPLYPQAGPQIFRNGSLIGPIDRGFYLYDPSVAHDGTFFDADTIDPDFEPDGVITPFAGSIYGAGGVGGYISTNFPYGAGVVYRLSPPGGS